MYIKNWEDKEFGVVNYWNRNEKEDWCMGEVSVETQKKYT